MDTNLQEQEAKSLYRKELKEYRREGGIRSTTNLAKFSVENEAFL